MFIPDPIFFHPGSRIRIFYHPGSRTRIKEFKYFSPKKFFLSSRNYYLGCSSRIRILIFYPSRIRRVKKAPDPGSGTMDGGLKQARNCLGVLGWPACLPVGPGVVHQVHVLRALQPNIHHSFYSPSKLNLRRRQGSAVWCQVFSKFQNNLKREDKFWVCDQH
jgi:hypothetical protein